MLGPLCPLTKTNKQKMTIESSFIHIFIHSWYEHLMHTGRVSDLGLGLEMNNE